MSLTDKLAQERRGRLAAERLLELKSRELFEANRELSKHALALSDQIVEKRAEVETVRCEAEKLKDVHDQTQAELQRVEEVAEIAERRLRDSVETMTDGFAVFDSQDRLLTANGAWANLFDGLEAFKPGITYLEMLELCVEEGLVDTEDRTAAQWLEMMLCRWDMPEPSVTVVRLWNGISLRLVDKRAGEGDMVCLAYDFTSTIRRERELKEARQNAEAASRAKSAFLARMSHELRTPMNGVVGMTDLLLETGVDDEQTLYLQTIRNSGEALLTIINDVLDFSKVEVGKLVLHREAFDLESMVHELLLLAGPSAKVNELELIVDYDMFLPTGFIGDQGRIRQVLTNLLGNAIKFTSNGHVMVRVVGLEGAINDAGLREWKLHVTVEDTGIGIDKDMQEHIFGHFNQVEDAENRNFEGTGLGLAITRQLVELMGGEVWVESEKGKGSCFGFALTLPIAEGQASSAADFEERPETALLVNGDDVTRSVQHRQLTQLGAAVTDFATGSEAISWMTKNPAPDVLVIDRELTDTKGLNLIESLRAQGHRVPALLSTKSSKSIRAVVDSDPMTMLVPRPMLRADLMRAMRRMSDLADTLAPEPTEASTMQPAAAAPAQRRMVVLAAEDNRTNQLVFRKMLKALDLDLTLVQNGAEAVEAWESLQPDLIFMDISMPGVDGKEATRRIRAAEAERGKLRVPIVAMTAHAMAGDSAEILAAGLDHYMTKPLKKAELYAQIELHCPVALSPFPVPEADAEKQAS